MKAIFKRELQAYFKTPVAYIFIGMFLAISAIYFTTYTLIGGSPSIDSILYSLLFVFMFLIPVLTMRLLSEEKNKKTDLVLFTAPVSVWDIILGKFFAACTVYLTTLLLTLIYLIVIGTHGEPAYPQILCQYIGFFLLGVSFISIGLFVSSLTENQIVSAIVTFIIILILYSMESLSAGITAPVLKEIASALSITSRFNPFNLGVLALEPFVYYLTIIALFLFLTRQVEEGRRWR